MCGVPVHFILRITRTDLEDHRWSANHSLRNAVLGDEINENGILIVLKVNLNVAIPFILCFIARQMLLMNLPVVPTSSCSASV